MNDEKTYIVAAYDRHEDVDSAYFRKVCRGASVRDALVRRIEANGLEARCYEDAQQAFLDAVLPVRP